MRRIRHQFRQQQTQHGGEVTSANKQELRRHLAQLDLELDPEPPPEELEALLAKAERDCFVGASLTVEPAYSWRVNGRPF